MQEHIKFLATHCMFRQLHTNLGPFHSPLCRNIHTYRPLFISYILAQPAHIFTPINNIAAIIIEIIFFIAIPTISFIVTCFAIFEKKNSTFSLIFLNTYLQDFRCALHSAIENKAAPQIFSKSGLALKNNPESKRFRDIKLSGVLYLIFRATLSKSASHTHPRLQAKSLFLAA